MNKYGQPLAANITQTILPAILTSGVVIGWYPIASHAFTGAETTYSVGDITVPVTTVTQDSGIGVPQYMAAVWDAKIYRADGQLQPWASVNLQKPDSGYYHWYSMPTEGWVEHFGLGTLLTDLTSRMNATAALPSSQSAPSVTTPLALTWTASVNYEQLNGDCEFFDFNWVTLFLASSTGPDPLRITTLTNPTPIAPATVPPMVAAVIGNPTLTTSGPVYNTIRIMKMQDVPTGTYAFTFAITDTKAQTTNVTLNLTIQ